jgi:hypothetical protein
MFSDQPLERWTWWTGKEGKYIVDDLYKYQSWDSSINTVIKLQAVQQGNRGLIPSTGFTVFAECSLALGHVQHLGQQITKGKAERAGS